MANTIILSLNNLLVETEELLLETEGLESWDAKYLIEISFSMIATSYDPEYESNKIIKRIIERIGLLDIINLPNPEKVFVIISKITTAIYRILFNNSLNKVDLCFKGWLGNDIVVRCLESPVKYLNDYSSLS